MFDAAGPAAREIEELTLGLLVMAVLVFVGVLAAIGWALRRHPDGRLAPELHAPSGISGRGPRLLVLGGGVVLPTIVIVVVFGWTVETMRDLAADTPPQPLTIELTGHQWWWEVRYPDEGIELVNEIHVPVGRAVVLRIESSDVIHSFWVPSLGGKMDAIPGRTNRLAMSADRPGDFTGQCAEFCGLEHARMALTVTSHAPEDFASWVTDRRSFDGTTGGTSDD